MTSDFLLSEMTPLQRALGVGGVIIEPVAVEGRLSAVPLGFRTLSAEHIAKSSAAALRWLKDEARYPEEYLGLPEGLQLIELNTKIEQLALALVDRTSTTIYKPVAKDANELRQYLTVDEVVMLYERFVDFVEARSPIAKASSIEDVMRAVDMLGKSTAPSSYVLRFDFASLRRIALELASRLTAQTNSPSSATSQPSEPGQLGAIDLDSQE